jgi:hypothetical protein
VPPMYMQFSVYQLRCIEHPSVGAVGALPHYRGTGAIPRNYVRDTSYGLETTRNMKAWPMAVAAFSGAARLRHLHYCLKSSI